ncbi:MAG: hypothetical protein ACLFQX_08105 [Candidatus Kapaibacterium sp.]
MAGEKNERICLIDPEKGDVTVRLWVDSNLLCGGDFRIQESDRKLFTEQWKMAVDDGRSISKQIKTRPADLNRLHLIWQILVCAKDPQIYEGKVRVSIWQGDHRSKLSIPAEWTFDNIPPCAINRSHQFTSSLAFIVKK